MNTHTYFVSGTTCRSCELAIEQAFRKLSGVQKVKVNGATGEACITAEVAPSLHTLQKALEGTHYTVHDAPAELPKKRPTFNELVGLFSLILFLAFIASRLGLFQSGISIGNGLGFGAVFVIGLVAASSSCIAVVGGLLLSSAARFNEQYGSLSRVGRMRPVVLFVIGRIASYTVLGGLLGVVGNILTPSPTVTAVITIIASTYMIIMGLDMLHLAPRFLKRLLPGTHKKLSHAILESKNKSHFAMPLLLGAATFFLPCGFTQALQLYALTTHSFWTSAGLLLAFSLGTAPALLLLGYASSSVKGKLGTWFFKLSGALVIALGLWNISNGLSLAGFNLSAPSVSASGSVVLENGTQVVRMRAGISGYEPNHFTVKANVPVRWEIQGSNSMGCASALVSRQLGVQKFLSAGQNVVTFTPHYVGEIAFSCSMGMYRGSFTVVQ